VFYDEKKIILISITAMVSNVRKDSQKIEFFFRRNPSESPVFRGK